MKPAKKQSSARPALVQRKFPRLRSVQMPASWIIKRHGEPVEKHASLRDAEVAFWILTAEALKSGGVADYELDTHSNHGLSHPDELAARIPAWAKAVLREHELMS